jgi:PKD repeat protein
LSGTPVNTTGWNLQGAAYIGNITGSADSEIIICQAVNSTSGAIFYNQPINLSVCSKWVAEFDFRLYDGTGADGLAFCFLDVPPAGFVNGGGLGIPNSANGLKVCFDTYNNCIPYNPSTVHQDMPKIEIRWGEGYNNDSDPNNVIVGECLNEPTRDNSDGRISYIRSPLYNHAKITYDSGTITVYVNDTIYLSGFQQFNFTGYLGFTASTGGYNDNESIKNVIIYTQMPPSVAGASAGFCPYDYIQLGGPVTIGYNYSWNPSTGLSDSSVANPLLHLSNDSSGSIFQTYYVRTGFTSNPGCSSVDSVTIRVFPNPKVNFNMPEICLTDAIGHFKDSSYTGDISTLPFSYNWNFADPNAGPGNPDNSTSQDPTHRYSAAANYPMSLTVTNSQGCTDSLSKIFTVNGAVPLAGFSVVDGSRLCSNQPVIIQNESSVNFGSITWIEIIWGDSSGVSFTDSFPYPGKFYNHLYPDPVSTTNASYSIKMISSSGISCGNELDQTITVLPAPHVVFDTIPTLCTYDSSFMISEALELSGVSGDFSFYGNAITQTGLFNPTKAGAGKDTLSSVFSGSNGCSDSAIRVVIIQAPPIVSIVNDTSIVVAEPLHLQAESSDSTGDTFNWSPATGLNNTAISNPVALLGGGTDSIVYKIRAYDSVGCFGQDSIKVLVYKTLPDIFVPNAFTPAGPVDNIFRPIPIGISSLSFFRVFNRWGQLVYSTDRIGEGWNGRVNGKMQDSGAYVWMVQGTTYTGRIVSKSGTVILIR